MSLPNQVASGDTNQNSTVLWTRSDTVGTVTFQYSTSPSFSSILGTANVTVTDPLLPVKVAIANLTAGTTYYYRATDATGATASGQLKTSSQPGTTNGLRFGVSGDWRGELSPYPAISNADSRNLEFFIEHGDTIYADYASPAVPAAQATSLNEYRLKHNEVYSSRSGLNAWGDLRSSTSVLATIDDHEVINDFAGGATSTAIFGATTGLVNDSPLYETGLQAFQEYNPLRNDFYGITGDVRTAGERKIYRYNTYGSDAATFVLDARSFRDPELANVTNPSDPVQIGTFLANSFNPSRTMQGRQQVDDLKRDLLQASNAGVNWKFIIIPEPIQNLGVVEAADRYEGYAAERTEILKFINDNNIKNVVFIAADIHTTLVNNLTYQNGPGQPQIPTGAFEISTGSVAFDAPFGPTVANLAAAIGLLSPSELAFYNSLPVANDADSALNDKDDFIKNLVNAQLTPLGYDPLGLNNNLPVANGLINATLLQGDYVASQTYGWTEFNIDKQTQKLLVTTYGIPFYTVAQLNANPTAIANLSPTIVSQFEVTPQAVSASIPAIAPTPVTSIPSGNGRLILGSNATDSIVGTSSNDTVNGYAGDDRVTARDGADYLDGGIGNDSLMGGSGNDTLLGGAGNDTLIGANISGGSIPGVGEIDLLIGGAGSDRFVLGDIVGAYYNDGNNANAGTSDYALISTFNIAEDFIQLKNGLTYAIGASPVGLPVGAGIFIDNDGILGLSANDELIGILQGVSAAASISSRFVLV